MKILKNGTYNKMVQEKSDLEFKNKELKKEINEKSQKISKLTVSNDSKEELLERKEELIDSQQKKLYDLEKENASLKEKNDTALLVIKDFSEKNDLLMVDKEELNKTLDEANKIIDKLTNSCKDLEIERNELKSKLSRPKAKKCTTETCTDCEKTAETPEPEQTTEEATPIPEEKTAISQEEYIKEFFSFLKNEDPKLPNKFKKAFDPEFSKAATCDEFLNDSEPEDFINAAFNWSMNKSVRWLEFSVAWRKHLKTFKK